MSEYKRMTKRAEGFEGDTIFVNGESLGRAAFVNDEYFELHKKVLRCFAELEDEIEQNKLVRFDDYFIDDYIDDEWGEHIICIKARPQFPNSNIGSIFISKHETLAEAEKRLEELRGEKC